MQDWVARFPALTAVLAGADHVDVHAVKSNLGLREFIAAMMNYHPRWLSMLYRVRKFFVAMLGMHQAGIPASPAWRAEQVPMRAGQAASFFTVRAAEEDRLWIADAEESHLRATLCVVREAGLFSLVTIVHYRAWTGPIYFNVIRPFHHLVLARMARAGAGGRRRSFAKRIRNSYTSACANTVTAPCCSLSISLRAWALARAPPFWKLQTARFARLRRSRFI